MKTIEAVVNAILRKVICFLCNIDDDEIRNVPGKGPLIIIVNHINFLEVPVLYLWMQPRKIFGVIKKATFSNPVLGPLARLWSAIEVDRDNPGIETIRKSMDVLKKGGIICLAPEGTRTKTGELRKGQIGAVVLARLSGSPVFTMAHYGGEKFWKNITHLRKTRITFRAGELIDIREWGGQKLTKDACTDRLMEHLSLLLPEAYRGVYKSHDNNILEKS